MNLLQRIGSEIHRHTARYATPVEQHATDCRCPYHEGWRHGYFRAAQESKQEAQRVAERDRHPEGAFTMDELRSLIAIAERGVES